MNVYVRLFACFTDVFVMQIACTGPRMDSATGQFTGDTDIRELMRLNKRVQAGLYVCAHDPEEVEQAVFRNVSIVQN